MSGAQEEIVTRAKTKQQQQQLQQLQVKKRGSISGATVGSTGTTGQDKGAAVSMEAVTDALLKINQTLESLTKQTSENTLKLTEISARLNQNTESINKLVEENATTRQIAEDAKATAGETQEKLEPIAKKVYEHDATLALWELQRKERNLKIRLIPENEGDNLVEYLTREFADCWDLQEDEFKITTAFRLGKKQNRKTPRDCLITLRSKEERDKILGLHFEKALQIGNSAVQIFKDIPKYFLDLRNFYKDLALLLKKNSIRFRWEFPQGLSFDYKANKVKIKTIQDKDKFLARYQEDLQKGTVDVLVEQRRALDILNLSFGQKPPPSEEEQQLGAVGGASEK